jgi:hypothetical protein
LAYIDRCQFLTFGSVAAVATPAGCNAMEIRSVVSAFFCDLAFLTELRALIGHFRRPICANGQQ